MKSIIYKKFGPPDVLQLQQKPKPVPADDEVLIRVHATTVTSGDIHLRTGEPLLARLFAGPVSPRNPVLGHEFAGLIEATGKEVRQFFPGDKVFGSTNMNSGAYAEYLCLPEDGVIAQKPGHISFEQAAAIPVGALTALYFLRKGNIQRGQKILVYGASGSVGTYAVQIARHLGAHVTGVCSSVNIELVKSLGADNVIDYTREDFTQSGICYDMIFDSVGKNSFTHCRHVLNPGGLYVTTAVSLSLLVQRLISIITGGRKLITGIARQTPEDLQLVKELVETGKIKPVLDKIFPLEQITEAHRYVEQGHKKGNVVIRVAIVS
jgi:NADPH:quinone reductase-like Zn-dependent oxidoreductase